ncbi:MAG: hypothetical protein AAB728_02130 [Patescibacteria group bacterium]
MLATVVSGMSYAAGDSFVGAGSPLRLAWVPFLSHQFADVQLDDATDVDAVINAGTENQTDLLQNGGSGLPGFSFQNADVGNAADTSVDTPINAGALNAAELLQLGGSSQTALIGASAATDVGSLINAASLNGTSMTQNGTDGAVQDATAVNSAGTDVDSAINAWSQNNVGIYMGNLAYMAGASWGLPADVLSEHSSEDPSVGSCVTGCGSSSSSSSSSIPPPCANGHGCPTSPCTGGCDGAGGAGGAGNQVAVVDLTADTDVDSTDNAVSSNLTSILQNSDFLTPCLLEGFQNADVLNIADADVDSTINAGSLNNVGLVQNAGVLSGFGTAQQDASVNVNANTAVDSTNNAVAMNGTLISQSSEGSQLPGCPLYGCGLIGIGGIQNADVWNAANASIDSLINAGSQNNIGVNQVGGDVDHGSQAQYAEVNAPAVTVVNSENNAVAANETGIFQYALLGGSQGASVGNNADAGVDSTINAGSQNNIGVNQVGGDVNHGAAAQYAAVNAPAATVVNSENNAAASNATGISQEGGAGLGGIVGGCGIGGFQSAGVCNNADAGVDSTINAGSQNNIGVNQVGGDVSHGAAAQYLEVNAPAVTVVHSENNAGASNETAIDQNGGGGLGGQAASVGNNADAGVDSTINAGSQNNIGVNQVGGDVSHGAAAQYLEVNAPAVTVVHSENNAGASNETAIVQEGPAAVLTYDASCGSGGCSLMAPSSQFADAGSTADSNVDSEINANSVNNIAVTQDGGNNANQSATVNSPSSTTVNSEINAGSSNTTGIVQEGGGLPFVFPF